MVIGIKHKSVILNSYSLSFMTPKTNRKSKRINTQREKINEEMIKKPSEACFAKLLLFFLKRVCHMTRVYTHQMSVLLRDCWEFLPTASTSDRSLRAIICAAGPQPSGAPRRRRLPKLLHSIGIKRATAGTPRALNRREHFQVGPLPLVR